MHPPRVRLTIGRVLLVIALCGLLLALEEWFHGFGVVIAFFSPVIILGFVLHRLHGGGGVLGATLGGGIGCAVFGISICLQNALSPSGAASTSGPMSLPDTYYVVFLAIFGTAVGYLLGLFISLFVGAASETTVWVMNEADGGKKAMIGYRQPTSSLDESIGRQGRELRSP